MITLGIETSCDETSVGILNENGHLLTNVVATQVDLHARYGGIVPEIASRQHVLNIEPVTTAALSSSGLRLSDISLIAVTYGPGLAGSLIVGLNFAKGLASSLGIPFVPVNHLEGHIWAAWITTDSFSPDIKSDYNYDEKFPKPLLCLIVSGGHTELVLMHGHGEFTLIGETKDDAVGEAFDKVARVLGLRYPGGPEIQKLSMYSNEDIEPFPRAWMPGTFSFSFSGLKTAVINRAKDFGFYPYRKSDDPPEKRVLANFAKAFQDSIVDVIVKKTILAGSHYDCGGIVMVGGVAANSALRNMLIESSKLPVYVPPVDLCTDNGAMIAMGGLMSYKYGSKSSMSLDVNPNLRIS
jgi:N6-L-threonylcarbamoyladenine synthase